MIIELMTTASEAAAAAPAAAAGITGNVASAAGLFGGALGVGLAGSKAVEAVGRNPALSVTSSLSALSRWPLQKVWALWPSSLLAKSFLFVPSRWAADRRPTTPPLKKQHLHQPALC